MPQGCDAADIKDPDNSSNLRCMTYLEKKVNYFNTQM